MDKGPNAFVQRHEAELRRLLARYRSQLLDDVVPFWQQRLEDRDDGGYFSGFDRQGRRVGEEKPGWFVGRTMYTFAALCNTFGPNPAWLHLAEVGRRQLDGPFALGNGRFAQMLARDGSVKTGFTSVFTGHFAAKGLYEYMTAAGKAGDPAERALAKSLTDSLLADVQDPAVLRMEGVPPGMQKHAINFMTLIVALESRQIFENAYSQVLADCVHRSLYVFANDALAAPFELVSLEGRPVLEGAGRLVDPGHTMESLWFAIHAGEATGNPEYAGRAGTILDWVLERAYDEEYGGFYQHVDVERTVPEAPFLVNPYGDIPAAWDDKIWWVQAEGLYALAASALYNRNERHFQYFLRMADYVENALRDQEYGEWFAVLQRDGAMRADCKGFALKGAYHVPRCLLNLCVLLQRALDGEIR